MINYFRRSFLQKVRSKSSLNKTTTYDHVTVRGSPKRSMSLGGPRMAAPIGETNL